MKRAVLSLIILAALGMLLIGCGGGGGQAAVSLKRGSAHITIEWPKKRAPIIPFGTAAILVKVYTSSAMSSSTFVTQAAPVVPPLNGGSSSVNLVDLPASQNLYVYAAAYPSYNANTQTVSGNPIAVGSQTITVTPGNNSAFSITMGASVAHYQLTINPFPVSGTGASYNVPLTTINGNNYTGNPINIDIGGTFSIELHAVDTNGVPVLLNEWNGTAYVPNKSIAMSVNGGSLDVQNIATSNATDPSGNPETSTTAIVKPRDLKTGQTIAMSYEDSDGLTRTYTFPITVSPGILGWTSASAPMYSPGNTPGNGVIDDFDVSTGSVVGLTTDILGTSASPTFGDSALVTAGNPNLVIQGTEVTDLYNTSGPGGYTGRIGGYYAGNGGGTAFPLSSILGTFSATAGLTASTPETYIQSDLVSGPPVTTGGANLDWLLVNSATTPTLMAMDSTITDPPVASYSLTISAPRSVTVGSAYTNLGVAQTFAYVSTFDPNAALDGGNLTSGVLRRVILQGGAATVDSTFDVSSQILNVTDVATDSYYWSKGADDLVYILDAAASKGTIWVYSFYGHLVGSIPLKNLANPAKFYTRIKVYHRTVYLLYVDKNDLTQIVSFAPTSTPPTQARRGNKNQ